MVLSDLIFPDKASDAVAGSARLHWKSAYPLQHHPSRTPLSVTESQTTSIGVIIPNLSRQIQFVES